MSLPPLGSPAFFEACQEADRDLRNHDMPVVKPKSTIPRSKLNPNPRHVYYTDNIKRRAVELYFSGQGLSNSAVASLLFKQFNTYVAISAVKGWTRAHNIKLKEQT